MNKSERRLLTHGKNWFRSLQWRTHSGKGSGEERIERRSTEIEAKCASYQSEKCKFIGSPVFLGVGDGFTLMLSRLGT